ncbi:MAG: rRNA maturation RNase YbeY [Gammaproteobacteria bacterium]
MIIDIQINSDSEDVPDRTLLSSWAKATLSYEKLSDVELTIRIVDEPEMTLRKGSTNVLSFPFEVPEGVDQEILLLGDIIICAPVVMREALAEKKEAITHWALMVVHGVLHLLGYDHILDEEAEVMEKKEEEILGVIFG